MTHDEQPASLHRYFAGLAENTFQVQLGVVDPPLIDYLSDMLIRFLRNDSVFKVRDLAGRPLSVVSEMFAEAENRVGEARREVHRHIGDFTLFWTGVYPEALGRLRVATAEERADNLSELGKRAYFIASTIETDEEEAPSELLQRISRRFDLCAYGLREVRREWERKDDEETPPTFLIN
jgi:hypothetical protein